MVAVTLKDIHVYQTLDKSYRAYVRKEHEAYGLATNVWGHNRQDAIDKLARILAAMDIPFDFTE